MIKKIAMATLLAATLSTSALAFEQQGVKEGNTRVGLNVTYDQSTYGDNDSSGTGFLTASWAKYFTDSVEGGLGITYMLNNPADGDADNSYTLSPFLKYNFSDFSPTSVPFIGASFVMMDGDSYEEALTGYGAEIGSNVFVDETTAFAPALYYQKYDFDGTDYVIIGVKIGIELFFD